jgi:hypothetical protein
LAVEVAGRVLVEDVSFTIRARDKVGLVGRNGADEEDEDDEEEDEDEGETVSGERMN